MSTLLIGFQDSIAPHHVLAKLDSASERLEWVELDAIDSQVHSVSGLCPLPNGYAVLLQAIRGSGTMCYLAELDSTLRLRRSTELVKVREGSGPVLHDGALLLIDRLTDQVIRITWPEHAATPTEEPIFSARAGGHGRTLSAIASFQERLYLSLSQSGTGVSNSDPLDVIHETDANGTILEFESGAVVAQLAQAGEFVIVADTLYCLNAAAHALVPVAGVTQAAAIIDTDDRLHGFAHHGGYIYIGAKSNVLPGNDAASVPYDAGCGLYLHSCEQHPTRRIDMSGFATAIGALLVLPQALAPAADADDPLLQRLRVLNAHTAELLRRYTHADHYHSECETLVRQLIDEYGAYVTAARLLRRLLQHAVKPRAGWHFDYATCLMHVGSAQEAVRQFQLALAHGHPAAPVMRPLARARAAAEGRTGLPLEAADEIAPAATRGKTDRTIAIEADTPSFSTQWLQAERTVEFDMAVLELMALLHSPDAA